VLGILLSQHGSHIKNLKVNLLDLPLTLEVKKFDYSWNSIRGFWLILTHHLKNKWQMGNERVANF
jgi:hypothetical protein